MKVVGNYVAKNGSEIKTLNAPGYESCLSRYFPESEKRIADDVVG